MAAATGRSVEAVSWRAHLAISKGQRQPVCWRATCGWAKITQWRKEGLTITSAANAARSIHAPSRSNVHVKPPNNASACARNASRPRAWKFSTAQKMVSRRSSSHCPAVAPASSEQDFTGGLEFGSHSPQANADRLLFFRLASSPEYRLCGRSLRTAMPSAFFCPISTSSRLLPVIPVKIRMCAPDEPYQGWLSRERVHTLWVVLEIHKPVAVVQLNLKLPEHCEPQKAGNLRPGVAAYGGEV